MAMDFGLALHALMRGEAVQRAGWNGKGMFLVYVPGTENCELRENTPYHAALNGEHYTQTHVTISPHIDMFTADGCMQPGWLASQADMLAEDWQIVL